MNKNLRFISISHKTATVSLRERYYISESDKEDMFLEIQHKFPDISGLLILVTCNRTEIYFESEVTKALHMQDYIIERKHSGADDSDAGLFLKSDRTSSSVRQLLAVSSGLSSRVLGDADIVHQIKKAYRQSISHRLQGSLLERAMQSVFKSHKRISNETGFRDGTTSTAYKSLKVVAETYRGDHPTAKKVLFVGAGDIVRQLLKYNAKFGFRNVYISNRTPEKALNLARIHGCTYYEWDKVLSNDFEDFDVIISAASNCRHLIREIAPATTKRLLIDLALPGNIDSNLSKRRNIIFYDLDTISMELEDTRDRRRQAISAVNKILEIELKSYLDWYHEAPLRAILSDYKIVILNKVSDFYESRGIIAGEGEIASVSDRVLRKMLKSKQFAVSDKMMQKLIEAQLSMEYALL